MQTGSALWRNRLVFCWPADGRTYQDPHVKTAQLSFSLFESAGRPAASQEMKPFVSVPAAISEAVSKEKSDLERVRAARLGAKPPLRLFRGDLHRHTDISADAMKDGDILDTYRYALDAAALDFLCVTDHSGHERMNYFKYDWWRTRQLASFFYNPSYFVTFFGYERTVTYPGGHRNIISARSDLFPFPISDEEYHGVESYGDRLFPHLKTRGDIAIPHLTAAPGGTAWTVNDPQVEPVVEIFQAYRGSSEEPNAPAKARATENADGFVWTAWKKGLRLGVIASSDHQSTHQSLACVYAADLARDSILDGLKKRRSFAATDNIVLNFQAVDSQGRIYRMGEEIRTREMPRLEVEVQGTSRIKRLELFRNEELVSSREGQEASVSFNYVETGPITGTVYYHFRAIQENNHLAWSSPIWVTVLKDVSAR
jgi:hypothetical protein